MRTQLGNIPGTWSGTMGQVIQAMAQENKTHPAPLTENGQPLSLQLTAVPTTHEKQFF